jgi:hypothetical protein
MVARKVRGLALAVGAILLSVGPLSADSVRLDGGGSLTGSVTTGSKGVAVRTATGAVIVFDRSAVKQVSHGRNPAAKVASNAANAKGKAQPKKRKLTAEEDAWMPKVRGLVSRLYGSDPERSQQAKNLLLNIDDPDAIPALSTHLGSSRDDEARHLYVVILHNVKGAKAAHYLVALSLFDPSPRIRSEARTAIREDQLDAARTLYIAALRSGPPTLARVAAVGLGEIGDPRGDSVPFLINALVTYGTVATITEPAQYGLLYSMTIKATPGLNLSGMTFNFPNSGMIYDGQTKSPINLTPSGMAQAQAALQKATGPNQPLGVGGTIYIDNSYFGGLPTHDFTPNSKGMPDVELKETHKPARGWRLPNPPTDDEYSLPVYTQVCPTHDKQIRGRADHPEVLDALLKITDQKHPGHGFNQDHWRSWWATEKANREMKKPAPDRVVSSGSGAH